MMVRSAASSMSSVTVPLSVALSSAEDLTGAVFCRPLPHRMPGRILSPTAGTYARTNLRSGGFDSMPGSQAIPWSCGVRTALSPVAEKYFWTSGYVVIRLVVILDLHRCWKRLGWSTHSTSRRWRRVRVLQSLEQFRSRWCRAPLRSMAVALLPRLPQDRVDYEQIYPYSNLT